MTACCAYYLILVMSQGTYHFRDIKMTQHRCQSVLYMLMPKILTGTCARIEIEKGDEVMI